MNISLSHPSVNVRPESTLKNRKFAAVLIILTILSLLAPQLLEIASAIDLVEPVAAQVEADQPVLENEPATAQARKGDTPISSTHDEPLSISGGTGVHLPK